MAQGALFLDRDGVVNRERGAHTWRVEDFDVLPQVADTVKAAHAAGLLTIVITNQSGIALGLYTHADVANVHAYLHRQLAQQGVALDAVYYCPHHPDHGRCLCRKPGSLLFERAIARSGIDPALSVMVGDRQRDIDAAAGAGVRGILVQANASLLETLKNEAIF
ncbi:MAG: D-glycero-alpha-D-manno-heptose-1,7-bisphosphate 7-phosphatase [Flavobacteriales bacterium]